LENIYRTKEKTT